MFTLSLLLNVTSHSIEVFTFETEEQRTQFQSIAEELRCPVCQNQSLADSDAELADDLRQQIFKHIQQGKSNEEIIQFMIARYGDFIIYKPRFNKMNLLLWIGPLLILFIGGWLLFQQFVKQQSLISSCDELNPEQQQQLKEILKEEQSGDSSC